MQFGHCYHSSVNLNFSDRLPDSYFCAVLIYIYHFLGFIYGQSFLNCQSMKYNYCHAMQLHHISSHCDICMLCWPSLIYLYCTFFLFFTASILLFYCFANAWEQSALLMIEVLFKLLLIPPPPPKKGEEVLSKLEFY